MADATWDEIAGAGGFIEKLNQHLASTQQPGAGLLRLATEAEWEYAARAGTSTPFSFGDDTSCSLDDCSACGLFDLHMWWCGSQPPEDGLLFLTSQPVGQKEPNPAGLYDMNGNLAEWVSDWYASYPSSPVVDPQGPESGSLKVVRDGDWGHVARYCRPAFRDVYWPDDGSPYFGFRVARSR